MADVEISYKGNVISSLSATGNKTLQTEGCYCEDDFEIAYIKPSAQGGITLLASGTYTLNADAAAAMTIPVTYSGTPQYIAIIRENELSDVGHALGSIIRYDLESADISAIFSEGLFSAKYKNSSNNYGYANAIGYKPTITGSNISVPKPGNSYPWKAGNYKWFIYGEV